MQTRIERIIPALRRRDAAIGGRCLVCRAAVAAGDERLRAPHGGWVHRRCATYRMRSRRGSGAWR